ncbi:MAG: YIP1 family protein [Candidatus Aminicenantes bacterium]|nr:YIP1 family protein [Candidatus Aminicenantes bacterium]
MNFFQRISGVFTEPKRTMAEVAERPVWIDSLIFLLIIWLLFSNLIAPFTQKDTISLMKNNLRLKELLGEERYAQRLQQLENPSPRAKFFNLFILPPVMLFFGFFLTSLFIFILGRIFSAQGKFIQVLACVLHANLIDKFLGNAIRLFLIFSKKSVFQTSTSLALLFPRLSYTSPAYIVLNQIDFFQLWLFGVLAFGLAVTFKTSMRQAFFLSYGFWFIKSLLYITLGLINLRYMS